MDPFVPSLWVILIPLVGAVTVALLGLKWEKVVPYVAVAFGLVNAATAIYMVNGISTDQAFSYEWIPGICVFTVVSDGLGAFIALTAAVLGALILIYSLGYMAHEQGITRYYSLVLMFIGAMSGLVLSGSLLTMYFFWEICGICSFSLIGFNYSDPKALKGAIKAFITTKIGDVGLLTGILVLYFSTTPHTFDIATILADKTHIAGPAAAVAAFAMLMGAVGKSAQVPLHVWLPDAMEAPTSVSALIHAATMVNAGVYLVARMYPAFQAVAGWTHAVTWVGTITLTLAAVMAVFARDLKRMLAYSTVSQLGYMFFAVGTGSILASQFHLVSHAIFKALLFLTAGALIHEAHTRDMDLISGAGAKMPLTGKLFLVGTMGLSGIPLMSGFFSKDMILAGALESGAYAPLTLAVFSAALTFTYSWRAYIRVFTGKPSKVVEHAHEVHLSMAIPMVILGIGAIVSWCMVGMQSGAIASLAATAGHGEAVPHSQAHASHVITPLYLVEETFMNPALLFSAFAIGVGTLAVVKRDALYEWFYARIPELAEAAFNGFYFDEQYLDFLQRGEKWVSCLAQSLDRAVDSLIQSGAKAFAFLQNLASLIDKEVIEGIGRSLGVLFRMASRMVLTIDDNVIEGAGMAAVEGVKKSSKVVRRSEAHDLNGNLIKLLLGVTLLLVIVVLETGVKW